MDRCWLYTTLQVGFPGVSSKPCLLPFPASYICNRIIQSFFSEGYTLSMSLANMWFSAI